MSSNVPTGPPRRPSASSDAGATKRTPAKVQPTSESSEADERVNGISEADGPSEPELFAPGFLAEAEPTPPPLSRPSGRGKPAADADEGHSTDPVRVYLREMGQVSLLTREGEVEIAKRIEAGVFAAQLAVLGNPLGIARLLEIGDLVCGKQVELRKVIDGLDDENSPAPEERRKQLLSAMMKIKKTMMDSTVGVGHTALVGAFATVQCIECGHCRIRVSPRGATKCVSSLGFATPALVRSATQPSARPSP